MSRLAGPAALLPLLAAALACAHQPRMIPEPFMVIAHRGASAHAPENTLPAFRRARELGATEVEADVQLSRDGVPFLFHDRELHRKTDASGPVRDLGAAELRQVEIGRWFDRTHPEVEEKFAGTRLSTLAELFESFGDAFHYHLEIKASEPELPRLLLEEIERFGLRERVTLTSFAFDQLERVRARDARVPITYLVRGVDRAAVDRAADAGFELIGMPADAVTPEIVRYAHDRGLKVRAWRVRTEADMERALAAGCDGMTVDWPERLLARLAGERSSASR